LREEEEACEKEKVAKEGEAQAGHRVEYDVKVTFAGWFRTSEMNLR
jgi:hypothetical protein